MVVLGLSEGGGIPVTCIIYVEVQGKSRWETEERGERILSRLEADCRIELIRKEKAGVIEVAPFEFTDTLEAEFRATLENLWNVILDYMPSVIEVTSPSRIELSRDELSRLMERLSRDVRSRRNPIELGSLEEIPLPPFGYDEEELAELIYGDRYVLYRVTFKARGSKDSIAKTMGLLGCGIDDIAVREVEGFLSVKSTLVSPVDSLMAVTALYAPERVEVLEPGLIDVTALELQNGLMDVAGIVKIGSIPLSVGEKER